MFTYSFIICKLFSICKKIMIQLNFINVLNKKKFLLLVEMPMEYDYPDDVVVEETDAEDYLEIGL